MVTFSAIAGDVPSGCDGAEAGTGYYEATVETGGEFLSICSDWATWDNLDRLALASTGTDVYPLSAAALADSIQVYVNGVESVSGWSYNESSVSVVFDAPRPEGGDTVRITYGGLPECE
jgi:hypothetical protein